MNIPDISSASLAQQLAAQWQGRFRFDPHNRVWLIRNGDSWKRAYPRLISTEARALVRQKADELRALANQQTEPRLYNKLVHRYRYLRDHNRTFAKEMVRLARPISVRAHEFTKFA
jgi:hypothetical protein